MAEDSKRPAAVYVSWGTFNNALDQLAQGVPNRVDRSVFPGQSGGVQNQLLAAFKFLGLIADDLTPTADMMEVAVTDQDARKAKLRAIISDRYRELFAIDLMKATPAQLGERMSEAYSAKGETREKAVRFFLAAASALDLPVSPRLLASKASGANGPSKRKRAGARRGTPPAMNDGTPQPPDVVGHARTVKLRSGETLTLSTTAGIFSLAPDDREFVFGLIDQMEKYEAAIRAAEDKQ